MTVGPSQAVTVPSPQSWWSHSAPSQWGHPGPSEPAEVLKITSQDKSRYPEHYLFLPYPKWRQVLDKNSWLELRPVTLDYQRFHHLRGLARFGTVRTVRERVKPRAAS